MRPLSVWPFQSRAGSIRPVVAIVLLIRALDLVRLFDIVWALTKGGPGTMTETISIYAYVQGFQQFETSYTAAIALLDGAVGLDSFTPTARQRTETLRGSTEVVSAPPYSTSYPVSWGAEVTVLTSTGERYKVSRKDCKGDPELALDNTEMRTKAIGLLQFGGLDDNAANQVCDSVLSMPVADDPGQLFSEFIAHALR